MTISVIGNLCGLGGQLTTALRSHTKTVGIATYAPWFQDSDASLVANRRWQSSTPKLMKLTTVAKELVLLSSSRGVVSLTGSLSSREYHWLFVKMGLRPYVAFATGSDLRELARSDSPEGLRARSYFQKARLTVVINFDPKTEEAVETLKLERVFHFRFPMLPATVDAVVGKVEQKSIDEARKFSKRHSFNIYLAASQDFSRSKTGAEYGSCKGNDLAINAILKIAKSHKFGVLIRNDGVDAALAMKMLEPIADRVHALPTLTRSGFHEITKMSDVVLDQFHVGTFGALALEAGRMAVPTITYLHDKIDAYYSSPTPFLNAGNSNEIAAELTRLLGMTAEDRGQLGAKISRWVSYEHSDRRVADLAEVIMTSFT